MQWEYQPQGLIFFTKALLQVDTQALLLRWHLCFQATVVDQAQDGRVRPLAQCQYRKTVMQASTMALFTQLTYNCNLVTDTVKANMATKAGFFSTDNDVRIIPLSFCFCWYTDRYL